MKAGSGASSGAPGELDLKRLSLLWALPEHAEAISRLHTATFADGWDTAAIARLLDHPGSIALVASHGVPPNIGGFILARLAADEAEILTMAVTEDWRRKGVANRLVGGLKRGAQRGGAQSIFLEVAVSNAPAIALYTANGFAEVGRRKGYYARTGAPPEDAVVMRCNLGS